MRVTNYDKLMDSVYVKVLICIGIMAMFTGVYRWTCCIDLYYYCCIDCLSVCLPATPIIDVYLTHIVGVEEILSYSLYSFSGYELLRRFPSILTTFVVIASCTSLIGFLSIFMLIRSSEELKDKYGIEIVRLSSIIDLACMNILCLDTPAISNTALANTMNGCNDDTVIYGVGHSSGGGRGAAAALRQHSVYQVNIEEIPPDEEEMMRVAEREENRLNRRAERQERRDRLRIRLRKRSIMHRLEREEARALKKQNQRFDDDGYHINESDSESSLSSYSSYSGDSQIDWDAISDESSLQSVESDSDSDEDEPISRDFRFVDFKYTSIFDAEINPYLLFYYAVMACKWPDIFCSPALLENASEAQLNQEDFHQYLLISNNINPDGDLDREADAANANTSQATVLDEDGEAVVKEAAHVNMHFPSYDPIDFALLNTVTDWPGMITTYQQIECDSHSYHSCGDSGATIPLGNAVAGGFGFGFGSGVVDSHCLQTVSIMSDVATSECFKVIKGAPHIVLQLAVRSNDSYVKIVNKYKHMLRGYANNGDDAASEDLELMLSEYDDDFILQYENDVVRYAREGLRYLFIYI